MIEVAGKQFRTLDDELFVNGNKVYWAKSGNKIVYPERDNLRYVLRLSGDINLTWQHQCKWGLYGEYKTYSHHMIGKFVCAIRSAGPFKNDGVYTMPAQPDPNLYLDPTHATANRPAIETIGFYPYIWQYVVEIATYGYLEYTLHDTWSTGSTYTTIPETQSTFENENGKERLRIRKSSQSGSGLIFSSDSRDIVGARVSVNVPFSYNTSSHQSEIVERQVVIAAMPFKSIDYANYDSTLDNPTLIEQAPLEMTHVSLEDLEATSG